jgi:hypothetical protein
MDEEFDEPEFDFGAGQGSAELDWEPEGGAAAGDEIQRISTRSVARNFAEADPIVLRELEQTRLVFLPSLHQDKDHPIRGTFVWQRKRKSETWEDIRELRLSELKSGQGYQLELHSAEVTILMDGLRDLRAIYDEHGIVYGSQEFVLKSTLPRMVRDIVDAPRSAFAAALRDLDEQALLSLGQRVEVSKLDALLTEWDSIRESSDEDDWQSLFARHAWVFSQLTGSPVVVIEEKAYVGGKGVTNTGGGQVDFLLKNALTDNVVFVEIKTPRTRILAAPYRSSGAFSLDREFTGGIVQVLGYKDNFEKEFYALASESPERMRAYNPRSFVIVGRTTDLEDAKLRCLDLFRNAVTGVQILTFDEVEARVTAIREALTADD